MARTTTLALALAVLGGCEPGALEPWHGIDDGTALLVDEPDEAYGLRARLFDGVGAARLTHDGPDLPPTEYVLPPRELVVVDAADQVRVHWSDRRLELLLWLDRPQLSDVVVDDVQGGALHPSGDGFVLFPAGADVVVLDEAQGRRQVAAGFEGWEVEAWVPADAVDQVWEEPWEGLRGAAPIRTFDHWVHGPIHDAPGGVPIAWPAEGAERRAVQADGEPVQGWWPVAFGTEGFEVRGWVYEDDVRAMGGLMGIGGCGGCGGSTSCGFGFLHPNVPAGTLLRSEPEGPVVGRTLRAMYVPFGPEVWGTVQAATPWGEAVLWVAEPL